MWEKGLRDAPSTIPSTYPTGLGSVLPPTLSWGREDGMIKTAGTSLRWLLVGSELVLLWVGGTYTQNI